MSNSSNCSCMSAPTLLFPCSGASDLGELVDQASRQMTRQGMGKMYCLAGVGGRVSGIMASTESADRILALDGCALNCASECLKQAGFKDFMHLEMTRDLGLVKGKTPLTPETLALVVEKASALLDAKIA